MTIIRKRSESVLQTHPPDTKVGLNEGKSDVSVVDQTTSSSVEDQNEKNPSVLRGLKFYTPFIATMVEVGKYVFKVWGSCLLKFFKHDPPS